MNTQKSGTANIFANLCSILPYCAAVGVIYGGYTLIEMSNQQRETAVAQQSTLTHAISQFPQTAHAPVNRDITPTAQSHQAGRTPAEILAVIEQLSSTGTKKDG